MTHTRTPADTTEAPRPRKKLPNESRKAELCRRLEEYAEYAHAIKRFADVGFYLELRDYIENQ